MGEFPEALWKVNRWSPPRHCTGQSVEGVICAISFNWLWFCQFLKKKNTECIFILNLIIPPGCVTPCCSDKTRKSRVGDWHHTGNRRILQRKAFSWKRRLLENLEIDILPLCVGYDRGEEQIARPHTTKTSPSLSPLKSLLTHIGPPRE